MATTTEVERLQARKFRLVQQNDVYRRNLAAEADNLRAAADLVERGVGFYQTVMRVKSWISPFFPQRKSKKRSSMAQLWLAGQTGLNLWRKFREG